MRVLVDTSVWSVALRPGRCHPKADRLRHMIVTGDQVCVLGIIIQEVLQGIANAELAESIQVELEPFDLLDLTREDYVAAATLHRTCRSGGIAAGSIDCLIAAAAERHDCYLLTLDNDFDRLASFCQLRLL